MSSAERSYLEMYLHPDFIVRESRADKLDIFVLFARRFGEFVPSVPVRLFRTSSQAGKRTRPPPRLR
jgi:hypothetical protein